MPKLRYRFGVRLAPLTLVRPPVDLDVAASCGEIRPGKADDTVDVDVCFTLPPHVPGKTIAVDSLHAIFVPAGQPEPATPDEAVASSYPRASADATGHADGGNLTLTVEAIPVGDVTGLTVIAYPEPDEPTPTPPPATIPAS